MNGNNDKTGIREGVARCFSQAFVYGIEAHKTLLQVHGSVPKFPLDVMVKQWTSGILTSSITSGVIFGTYFSVYHRIEPHFMAGTVASVATSVIKIPISNGMRMMQSGHAPSLGKALVKISRAQSWRGLYSGYCLSLLEDIIEFDLRNRIYKELRSRHRDREILHALTGCIYGSISGAVAAGVTTPIDTVRSHLAVHAGTATKVHPLMVASTLVRSHGLQGLYRGVSMRITSNIVKSGLFFTVLELLH